MRAEKWWIFNGNYVRSVSTDGRWSRRTPAQGPVVKPWIAIRASSVGHARFATHAEAIEYVLSGVK